MQDNKQHPHQTNNDDGANGPASTINYSSFTYLIRLAPLFLAVSRCNHAATELLLTYDACPNIQDELGNTPLHLAVAKRQPCRQCVELLLKYHATSLVFNNRLQSPMNIISLVTSSTFESSPAAAAAGVTSSSAAVGSSSSGGANNNANSNHTVVDSSLATTPNSADAVSSKTGSDDVFKDKWDYSLGYYYYNFKILSQQTCSKIVIDFLFFAQNHRNIYCSLIKDIFKNLDTINSSPSSSAQTDPSKMQRASTIIIQQNRNMLPLLQLNVKPHHHQQHPQQPTTPSKSSPKSVTSYLKKAHTLAQNSSSKQNSAMRGHIPVSNSMKNLAKIKAHISSNSLSTLAAAGGGATTGHGAPHSSSHGHSGGHYRQEFFKRVLRNHSSSVESPTTPASPPIFINTSGGGTSVSSPQQAPASATATATAAVAVAALPSPKSPKILIKQTTKVNLVFVDLIQIGYMIILGLF